jgi:hypothetical protein
MMLSSAEESSFDAVCIGEDVRDRAAALSINAQGMQNPIALTT